MALGEAAVLSARIIRSFAAVPEEARIGMKGPLSDDRQFALNILHWLSHAQ